MKTIQDIREKYPAYNDLSDAELADKLHAKYYSDIPKQEFYQKIGLSEPKGNESKAAIGSYLKEIPIGLLETGLDIHNALGRAGTWLSGNPDREKYSVKNNFREMLGGVPEEERNLGHRAAGFVPELAASLAAPEVAIPAKLSKAFSAMKGGKYAEKVLKQALTQGGVGAAFNPNEALESGETAAAVSAPFSLVSELTKHGHPLIRKAARGALATTAGFAGRYGAKEEGIPEAPADFLALTLGGLALRPNLHTLARKINENRVSPKLENKLMQAGERLGIDVGPHEANPNYPMGKVKGSIGLTAEGATGLVAQGEKRLGQEAKSIEKLFNDMSPAEQELAKKNLYKDAYNTRIPEETIKPFKENENIKKAISSVEKEPEFREEFKNIKSKDNLEYWDLVKRALDARIDKAGTKNNGDLNTIGRLANKSKNALVKELDKVVPEYEQARNFAQKEIVRDKLEYFFNKKKLTMANMTKALNNKTEVSNLLKVFKDKPEVRQQIIDMKRLSEHLHSNLPNAKAGAKLEATSVNKPRSDPQYYAAKFNEIFNKKYDKAAVELMTNPKWREEVHRLSHVTDREKLGAKFIDLAGKAAAQGTVQSQKKKK